MPFPFDLNTQQQQQQLQQQQQQYQQNAPHRAGQTAEQYLTNPMVNVPGAGKGVGQNIAREGERIKAIQNALMQMGGQAAGALGGFDMNSLFQMQGPNQMDIDMVNQAMSGAYTPAMEAVNAAAASRGTLGASQTAANRAIMGSQIAGQSAQMLMQLPFQRQSAQLNAQQALYQQLISSVQPALGISQYAIGGQNDILDRHEQQKQAKMAAWGQVLSSGSKLAGDIVSGGATAAVRGATAAGRGVTEDEYGNRRS
jgi:hypothetical protein